MADQEVDSDPTDGPATTEPTGGKRAGTEGDGGGRTSVMTSPPLSLNV
jgi:hypothetical protein